MGSLRGFHIFFVLVVIAAADFFGIWSIWDYRTSGRSSILALGILSLIGGLGLIVYIVWFIRKSKEADIQ